MKRQPKRLRIDRQMIRTLAGRDLEVPRGAQVNESGTACNCHPSDGILGHCATDFCSGAPSCDPVDCTISLSG